MQKQTLAIQLQFDFPTIKKAIALVTGVELTDEEIKEKYIDCPPVQAYLTDMLGVAAVQACAGMIGSMIAVRDGELKILNPKKKKKVLKLNAVK